MSLIFIHNADRSVLRSSINGGDLVNEPMSKSTVRDLGLVAVTNFDGTPSVSGIIKAAGCSTNALICPMVYKVNKMYTDDPSGFMSMVILLGVTGCKLFDSEALVKYALAYDIIYHVNAYSHRAKPPIEMISRTSDDIILDVINGRLPEPLFHIK